MTRSKPFLLMTRPERASRRFLGQCSASSRAEVVVSPLMGIEYHGALPDLSPCQGLIFTSVNGVEAYQRAQGVTGLVAHVVGQTTGERARQAGFKVATVEPNAEALVATLTSGPVYGPLLHIRGTHARGDVAMRLTQAGIETIEAIMYDQPELALTQAASDALHGEIPVIAPIFSPRTAALLAKNRIKAPLLVAAMSEAVAKPLSELHITELRIAARPESAEMAHLVTELIELACAKDFEPDR